MMWALIIAVALAALLIDVAIHRKPMPEPSPKPPERRKLPLLWRQ